MSAQSPVAKYRFFGRTLVINQNQLLPSFKIMNKILSSEGLFDNFRRNLYYEKPCNKKRRLAYERCKAIYEEDMSRKIKFIMRKNRAQPFPGQ